MDIEEFGFKKIGYVQSKDSSEIESSKMGIGFETLDRDMWDVNQAWPYVGKLGVKRARVQSGWAKTEKVKGCYDFSWLDEIVDKLLERGIHPWLSLSYGNKLYTPEATDDGTGFPPIYTECERKGWTAYVKATIAHYQGRVKEYEIWNEPDASGFFRPKTDPVLYTDLLKLTVEAVKSVDESAYIIGGALGCAMNPKGLEYLKTCFHNGMADYIDAIAYHGYKYMPEQYLDQEFPAFMHLINSYKPGLKYWQGETGCPSYNAKGCTMALSGMEVSETIQAKWMLRRVLLELGLGVEHINYFTMDDFSKYLLGGDLGFSSHKGVIRASDGQPKPSFYALQNLCSILHDPLEPANGRTSFRMQSGDDDNSITREQAASAYQVNLLRGDVPVQAWWLREEIKDETTWKSITMYYWLDDALKLDDPILIDPMSGAVYQLELKVNYSMNEFANLPISNYPLILTDKSIVSIK